ncbi:hypothetical protein BU16DRAFT_526835 [Lophium mytilinum]|uniref:Uncharacterized protein n=1 Tax=Lophium mytilinum TaxID=390894 RepID=A0A6A6QWY8_9PEZI|nr:hypothetical protein BU16DRAFT_526835 [Lophium mytilinum]
MAACNNDLHGRGAASKVSKACRSTASASGGSHPGIRRAGRLWDDVFDTSHAARSGVNRGRRGEILACSAESEYGGLPHEAVGTRVCSISSVEVFKAGLESSKYANSGPNFYTDSFIDNSPTKYGPQTADGTGQI